jgi:uncharacterized repeat protein (TIGR03837 family)
MTIHSWDIFCRVVDNFGDIGVSWRLAHQLAMEHAARVRLWVDDLSSLHAIWPEIDPSMHTQAVALVEVRLWKDEFADVQPATVAIEAFGCGLPDAYVARVIDANTNTLWITLEYLSAEPWVASHHGLPSPHPRWPVRRYFFFPGFTAGTGGVLREADLLARRDAFDAEARASFWRSLGFQPPAQSSTVVSLFAYDHAPLQELESAWAAGTDPMVAVIPQRGLATPATHVDGALETRLVPFLSQLEYDKLLWACDYNFVRGEDSFVRAQWAGRPFVWQAYPQALDAHFVKLDAFLVRYSDYLSPDAARATADFWRAWNRAGGPQVPIAELWRAFREQSRGQQNGLAEWNRQLASVGDLASNLAHFCENTI